MNKKNLLFITEGECDEPKFIRKMLRKCFSNVEYNIYSYNTTIHTLAKKMFNKKGEIDKDLDIRGVLKEDEVDIVRRKILEKDYTDIILVFDFEPHCNTPEFEKVKKHFVDQYIEAFTPNICTYCNRYFKFYELKGKHKEENN